MPRRNLAWLLTVPALVLLGLAISASVPPPDTDYKLIRQVVDVLAIVDENYYRELNDADRQKLVEAMINGGLHELDPHSEYFNAKKLEEFKQSSEGSYGGVGIVLEIDPETHELAVRNPMPGTPAYDKGVLAGDRIVKVNGKPFPPIAANLTDPTEKSHAERAAIDSAKAQITGPLGTDVALTLHREGRIPAEFDVSLTRSQIQMHPVAGVARRKDDPSRWEWFVDPGAKIAYVRLKDSFNDLTTKELRAAVEEIMAAGGRGLILDLRDNPGGLLSEAISVANVFLPGGEKIVSTRDRHGNERTLSAKKEDSLFIPTPDNPRPMAVLINRHSASASEIVAAALQDHQRAVVVGERSFGKGSVQKLLYLNPEHSAAIKLTTETYWRPSGKNIHRARNPDAPESEEWGVRPSPGLEVPTTETERLRFAYEMLKKDYVPGKPGFVGLHAPPFPIPKGADGKPIFDESKPFEDSVLKKAVEVLKAKK